MRVATVGELGAVQISNILRGVLSLGKFNGDMPDIIVDGELEGRLNILVINDGSDAGSILAHMHALTADGVAVINADDKRIYRFLPKCPAGFITYGFNSKASVTASSVDMAEGDFKVVQICVQRALRNYAHEVIEQQEFSIRMDESGANIHCILAAVTSALYIGVPPLSINEAGGIRSKLSR